MKNTEENKKWVYSFKEEKLEEINEIIHPHHTYLIGRTVFHSERDDDRLIKTINGFIKKGARKLTIEDFDITFKTIHNE